MSYDRGKARRMVAASLAAGALVVGFAAESSAIDYGSRREHDLMRRSRTLFGFGRPVETSATTPSFDGPGEAAVELAGALRARVVTSTVGEIADMMDFWPNDTAPTHVIVCNEVGQPSSFASVQRVALDTGAVTDMVTGLRSCDPVHRTPWGTIVVGEEAGASGRLWEIVDPLSVSGIVADPGTGTTSDPTHMVARTAVGQLSFEGIVILPDGTMYYGDELRPSATKVGGGQYKFVPQTPWAGGVVANLAESPLSAGSAYVLRLGIRSGGTDNGQGSNTGAGKWIGPLDLAASSGNAASAALALGLYTGFYRPEDMDLDPIAFAAGRVRICWANTGNDQGDNFGEILCLNDGADASFPTGTKPIVEPFVLGNPHLRMPDNVAFQPGTGILYVNMDATTSAEDPNFGNDDVWACLPDGDDADTLSDGCVRVMTLKDGAAEFTGIRFYPDGKRFLIHLQHRTQAGRAVPNTTDMLEVSLPR